MWNFLQWLFGAVKHICFLWWIRYSQWKTERRLNQLHLRLISLRSTIPHPILRKLHITRCNWSSFWGRWDVWLNVCSYSTIHGCINAHAGYLWSSSVCGWPLKSSKWVTSASSTLPHSQIYGRNSIIKYWLLNVYLLLFSVWGGQRACTRQQQNQVPWPRGAHWQIEEEKWKVSPRPSVLSWPPWFVVCI